MTLEDKIEKKSSEGMIYDFALSSVTCRTCPVITVNDAIFICKEALRLQKEICAKAIYSEDWDKDLYLIPQEKVILENAILKAVEPTWEN